MEKVIRDGKVAIALSPGYGAGWYSWHREEQLIFHPVIIEMIENGKNGEITQDWLKENLGFENVYCGGAEDLIIKWLPEGIKFKIEEYDGSEYLLTEDSLNLIA